MTLATFTGHTSSCQRLRKAVQSYKKNLIVQCFRRFFLFFFCVSGIFFIFSLIIIQIDVFLSIIVKRTKLCYFLNDYDS